MSLTDDVQCHSRNSLKLLHFPSLFKKHRCWSNSSLDLPKFHSRDSKIFKECKEFKRLTSIELWTSADSRRRTHGISTVFNKKSNPYIHIHHLLTSTMCFVSFNQLDLPEYGTFEQLKDMLLKAVTMGNVGFGLYKCMSYNKSSCNRWKRGWGKSCGQMQQMIGRLMPFFKLQNCTQNSRRPHYFVPRPFAESLTWTIFSEPHVGHNRFVLTQSLHVLSEMVKKDSVKFCRMDTFPRDRK